MAGGTSCCPAGVGQSHVAELCSSRRGRAKWPQTGTAKTRSDTQGTKADRTPLFLIFLSRPFCPREVIVSTPFTAARPLLQPSVRVGMKPCWHMSMTLNVHPGLEVHTDFVKAFTFHSAQCFPGSLSIHLILKQAKSNIPPLTMMLVEVCGLSQYH